MSRSRNQRRLNHIALCASLVLVTVLFGVRAAYAHWVYCALVAVQLATLSLTAWKLGLRMVKSQMVEQKVLAVSGGLLLAPWLFFSLLPGYGRPDEATHVENQFRYLILFINAIAVGGGMVMLRQTLADAGDRFYSTIGFACISIATPLYLVWAAILIQFHRVLNSAIPAGATDWIRATADFSDILLFFSGVLTYFATAAYSRALSKTKLIGNNASGVILVVSLVAVVLLTARGLQFPDPAVVFEHWYKIPGWIAGIPAVPWIMPCCIGVSLLKRAGNLS